jgi:predicted RNase H-like HicB family nuclease
MNLMEQIHATTYFGDRSGYVAECQEIAVVTQGNTLYEVASNLREAVALYLEDEDTAEFGLVAKPSLLVTFEL